MGKQPAKLERGCLTRDRQVKTDMSDTALETVRSQSDLGGTSAVRAWGILGTILPLYLL